LNKIVIPAILVATVMVAGMFAFMPVEQASTVHTSGTITLENDADIDAILVDTDATLPAEHTEIEDTQFNQVVTFTATNSAVAVEATSNADFILTVCFTDDDDMTLDRVVVTNAAAGGGDLVALIAPIVENSTLCATLGGEADAIFTLIPFDANGDTVTYATLLTTSDADASIAVP